MNKVGSLGWGKKYLQVILLLSIVLFNLGLGGIRAARAAGLPPANDNFANATPIPTTLPYNPSALDTTGASLEPDDPELNLTVGGCEGIPLRQGRGSVWYSFTPTVNTPVYIDTAGSTTSVADPNNPPNNYQYDTYVAVFTGSALNNLSLLACNDNPENATQQGQVAFYALTGTTYYIEVAQYMGRLDQTFVEPGYQGGSLSFHVSAGLTITGNTGGIGGAKVSFTGGTTTANSSGDYVLAIPSGFTGTVRPSKSGYLFTPPVRTYTNVTTGQTGQSYSLYSLSPADFNGDHKADVAVFRPSNTTWYIKNQGSTVFGQAKDVPVPADYDGDGKTEIAVYRPSNSTWYIQGQAGIPYGVPGDIPVAADYNGDGIDEIAVFRTSNSTWYIKGQGASQYGQDGDIPVVADYNGDGKADIAVFRPTVSTWYIKGVGPRVFGQVGDIPVIADYNGDGKADVAVFRPTTNTWYIQGIGPRTYGQVGDVPVIGDYNGDGKADVAVFRPTNSTWYIQGVGPSVYGTVGDVPV